MVGLLFALSSIGTGQGTTIEPGSAEEYYLLAKRYLYESDSLVFQIDKWHEKRREALSALNKAVELEPENKLYIFERAKILIDDGESVLALRELNKLIGWEPDNPEFYSMRAEVYETEGVFDKAIADRDKAIRLRPDDPAGYVSRAGSFVRNNKHSEAVEDYTHALILDPKSGPALEGRALAYELLGNLAKAIDDWTALIGMSPVNEKYFHLIHRADLYEKRRQYSKAAADLTFAIRLAPDIPEPYELRARVYRAMGKTVPARLDELKAKRLLKK
jgi:tetratricopeptide (TPR) repeat protein